ncbi:hypothetical protein PA598K_05879 [Paenibacillus sp. 598K]|uniref:S-layer homology domain-containing protein n=1 Tax=Paenibacillus sp. 598K TaxID=1117987 RepID=UPI000FFAE02A|nr:S-layer homology domain-containing protein [Paenibacillus sp. 598K]GBF77335.1 hypothetical protein PA598K_05879 [Paenibacillus sp. 598K]
MKKIMATLIAITLLISFLPAKSSTVFSATPFKDVPNNHWAKDAIDFAAQKGYVGGYPDGRFIPNGTITRAEFTAVLVRIAGVQAGSSGAFTDIQKHWASDAIQTAVAQGIIAKEDFGSTFQPNKNITRLEMSRMIARALSLDTKYKAYLDAFKGLYNGDLPFVDYREMKDKDLPFIGLAFGARTMNGYPDASFGLNKNATRAEAVVMLKNYHDNRSKTPESFQYLRELKEVAETGMNAAAVSRLVPEVNLKTTDITLKHPAYDVTVKRVYVLPLEGNVVSLYEKKYLWDRNLLEDRLKNNKRGYVVASVKFSPKKNGDRMMIMQSLALNPSANITHDEPFQKYGLINEWMKQHFTLVKDVQVELSLYGSYSDDKFRVYIDSIDSNLGNVELLFNPDKKRN